MAKKFIEIVGNASTTAWNGDDSLGHNVNVSAYEASDDKVELILESNASRVPRFHSKFMTKDEYRDFCNYDSPTPLFVRALRLFGLTTSWS